MNTEHQLKSKLIWTKCPKSENRTKNGSGAMTTTENAVFIGL